MRLVGSLVILGVTLGACGFQVAGGSPVDGGIDEPPADADGSVSLDTPDAPSECLDGAWCRRRKITIAPAMIVGGPHIDFPLLVSIAADLDLAARASGNDIVFTAADGMTRLPYERQSFSPATGALTAWVTLPALTSTTEIYLWYGNASASDQQSALAWPASYKGVYHFDANAQDSSQFGNNGSATAAFGGTGKVGGTAVFDGATDQVAIPNSNSLDAVGGTGTFEMWLNFVDPSTTNRFQILLSSAETFVTPANTTDGYSLATQPDGDYYLYPWARGSNFNLAANPFAGTTWQYAAATFDFATKTVKLFANGVDLGITVNNTSTLWTQVANPSLWYLGMNPGSAADYFSGQMDEVRFSAAVRSPSWITTTYRNVGAPSTFITLGALETF